MDGDLSEGPVELHDGLITSVEDRLLADEKLEMPSNAAARSYLSAGTAGQDRPDVERRRQSAN